MTDLNKNKTVVDYIEIPLVGPIYDGVDGRLFLEVREMDPPQRTLVITTMIDGNPVTTLVMWDTFTEAFDAMRDRMLGETWDAALASLMGDNT